MFIVYLNIFFLGPAPMAYGGYQARSQIGAVANSLHQSQASRDLSHICDLHHS